MIFIKNMKEDVLNCYSVVVKAENDGLKNMLHCVEEVAYDLDLDENEKIWSLYELSDNVAILTGHNDSLGKHCPREKEFNYKAGAIWNLRKPEDLDKTYEERERENRKLHKEFIKYCEDTYGEWE